MRTRFVSGSVWLLLCVLAGACAPAATPAALQPVRICYNATSGAQITGWYAYEKGLFQKYGLEPELTFVPVGPALSTSLLEGEVDFCQSAGSNVVNAVAAGGDLVKIMGYYDRYLFDLVVGPDIQQPQDLVGKSIGVGPPGGLRETAARVALQHLGLDPDHDVTFTPFNNVEEAVMAAAVESGSVAATILAPPLLPPYQAMGLRVLLDISSVDSAYARLGLVSTRSYLSEHRDVGLAVVKAALEAQALIRQDPEGTKGIVAQYLSLDPAADAAILDDIYDVFVVRYLAAVPYPSEAGLQASIDEAAVNNPSAAGLTVAELLDNGLLREVEDSGFLATLNR